MSKETQTEEEIVVPSVIHSGGKGVGAKGGEDVGDNSAERKIGVDESDSDSDSASDDKEDFTADKRLSVDELPHVRRANTPPPPSVEEYEAISPKTRQMVGQKRGRERRGALLPNTMTAKLVEQAAERHRIKRKAESEGREADSEELDLCGISEQMQKSSSSAASPLMKDVSGILEEEDIVFSKRQRRGSK
ncbi:hypothetical protein TrVE_jg12586 [Triparma verrucosa]|uniref:Uncharacterized protein n=1 Tax=Triparma verrucosa TaxID=1606542 RepID=A0A9W7KVQ0_9STRA|nr:hypothetical protein TrVE_jg12586 [Triparma verrucosa]